MTTPGPDGSSSPGPRTCSSWSRCPRRWRDAPHCSGCTHWRCRSFVGPRYSIRWPSGAEEKNRRPPKSYHRHAEAFGRRSSTAFFRAFTISGCRPETGSRITSRTYVERDLREVMQVSDSRTFERFVRLAAAPYRPGAQSHLARERRRDYAADGRALACRARNRLSRDDAPAPSRELPQAPSPAPRACTSWIRGSFATCSAFATPGRWKAIRCAAPSSNRSWSQELIKSFAVKRRDPPPLLLARTPPGTRSTSSSTPGSESSRWRSSLAQTVAADAVDALVWWRSIPSNPNGGGILVHGGAESFDFKGCRVLPWFLR